MNRRFCSLLRRELEAMLEGYRARAVAGLIFALMVFAAWFNTSRYQTEVRTHKETWASYERQLEWLAANEQLHAKSLVTMEHVLTKPPWELSFLAEGGQTQTPNVYRLVLSLRNSSKLETPLDIDGLLPASEPLDWMFVVRVLLSLGAFVLGYDSLCGVRQRGALKMALSYPVSRGEVMVAKWLSVWVCLAVPFLLGAFVSLPVIYFGGSITLDAQGLLKSSSVLVLSVWGIAIFALIALAVSALFRESSRSLAILALLWVTLVVAVPAAAGLLAHLLHPTASSVEIERSLDRIRERIYEERGTPSWRFRKSAAEHGFDEERRSLKTEETVFENQQAVRRNAEREQLVQLQRARDLSAASPMSMIHDLTLRVTGSGLYRDQAFLRQIEEFRPRLQDHVRHLDREDPESPELFFIEDYMSEIPADASEVPRFVFREATFQEGLELAWRPLMWLSLLTASLLVTVWIFFERMDLR